MVKFYLAKNQPEKALVELDTIEDSYFKNRDYIDRNSPENEHLMGYLIAGLGIECEDPTKVVDFFHFELRKMITELQAKPVQVNCEAVPDKLDDILHDPGFCFSFLMDSEPPVISNEFRFLLDSKKKFKIVAWYEVLNERGYVRSKIKLTDLVRLVNAKIEGLNLGKDGRIFRGEEGKAHYFDDFKNALISKIPKFLPSQI